MNSAEALAGSHITQVVDNITPGSTYTLRRHNPRFEDIKIYMDVYVPPDSSENDRIYQFMDNYDKWGKSPNTAGVNDMGSSHTFTVDNTSDSTNESIKLKFWIGKHQS